MPTIEEKFATINSDLNTKISQGFVFQGKTFSWSIQDQITLTNLYLACQFAQMDRAVSKNFALPFIWNTIDDKDYILLVDNATVSAFYATALGSFAAALKTANIQKVGVRFTDLGMPFPVMPVINKSASVYDTPPTTSEEVGVEVPPEPDPPPEEEVPPEEPPPEGP